MTLVLPLPIPFPPYHRHSTPKWLPIWMELVPSADSVRFDPLAVRVVTTAGDTLRPVGFWGPGLGSLSGDLGNGLCHCGIPHSWSGSKPDQPFYKRTFTESRYDYCFECGHDEPGKRSAAPPQAIQSASCFVVEFPHPPGYEYTVIVDGIEIAGRPQGLPPLRYARGTYWWMVGIIPVPAVWI